MSQIDLLATCISFSGWGIPYETCASIISGGSRISRRGGVHPLGGHEPPMQALFGENVCENVRIGSHRGWRAPGTPP